MIAYARKQGLLRILFFANLYDARLYQYFWEGKSLILYHVAILLSAFMKRMYLTRNCSAISFYSCSWEDYKIGLPEFLLLYFGRFYPQLGYVTMAITVWVASHSQAKICNTQLFLSQPLLQIYCDLHSQLLLVTFSQCLNDRDPAL